MWLNFIFATQIVVTTVAARARHDCKRRCLCTSSSEFWLIKYALDGSRDSKDAPSYESLASTEHANADTTHQRSPRGESAWRNNRPHR